MIKKSVFPVLPVLVAPFALFAGAAVAGGLATPVETAAPVPVVPVPAARSSDWTGFYVGGQLGYADLEFSEDVDAQRDYRGALYGVHAGYMQQLGSLVVGAEFDYDLTTIEEEFDAFDGTFTVEVDSIMRLKARLGYDAGAFMPYLTGGVARATISSDNPIEPGEIEADGDFFGLGAA